MEKENLKGFTAMELLIFQSEVMSRTPVDLELKEEIYEELKRRRTEANTEADARAKMGIYLKKEVK